MLDDWVALLRLLYGWLGLLRNLQLRLAACVDPQLWLPPAHLDLLRSVCNLRRDGLGLRLPREVLHWSVVEPFFRGFRRLLVEFLALGGRLHSQLGELREHNGLIIDLHL